MKMLAVTEARISASHTHAQPVPCPVRAQSAHLPLCSPACKPVFGGRSAPSRYRGKVRQRWGALANVWGSLRLEDIEDVEARATEVCLLFSATPPDSFTPCIVAAAYKPQILQGPSELITFEEVQEIAARR